MFLIFLKILSQQKSVDKQKKEKEKKRGVLIKFCPGMQISKYVSRDFLGFRKLFFLHTERVHQLMNAEL